MVLGCVAYQDKESSELRTGCLGSSQMDQGMRSLRKEGLKGGGKDETPKMPTAAGKILH